MNRIPWKPEPFRKCGARMRLTLAGVNFTGVTIVLALLVRNLPDDAASTIVLIVFVVLGIGATAAMFMTYLDTPAGRTVPKVRPANQRGSRRRTGRPSPARRTERTPGRRRG